MGTAESAKIRIQYITFYNHPSPVDEVSESSHRIFYYATGPIPETKGGLGSGHGLTSGSETSEINVVETLSQRCDLSDMVNVANGPNILIVGDRQKVPISPKKFKKLAKMLEVISPQTTINIVTERRSHLDL